jgi:hypothetical protein
MCCFFFVRSCFFCTPHLLQQHLPFPLGAVWIFAQRFLILNTPKYFERLQSLEARLLLSPE